MPLLPPDFYQAEVEALLSIFLCTEVDQVDLDDEITHPLDLAPELRWEGRRVPCMVCFNMIPGNQGLIWLCFAACSIASPGLPCSF